MLVCLFILMYVIEPEELSCEVWQISPETHCIPLIPSPCSVLYNIYK
jgi:hypothetical protein